MNATQCWRAARPQTLFGRYRKAAFAGLAAAAIVCGPVSGQPGPASDGEWNDPPIIGPNWGADFNVYAMHAVHLPTGSILVWRRTIIQNEEPFLWNPVLNTLTEIPTDLKINCSGHAGLPDGTILFAGGGPSTKETKIFSFEGSPAGPWRSVPDMFYARFYPTCTTLPDGRVLTSGGRDPEGDTVFDPEIFDPGNDPLQGTWGLPDIQMTEIGEFYPYMFVVPSIYPDVQKVFFSGSLRPSVVGADTYMLDIPAIGDPSWTAVGGDPLFQTRWGSAVMYEPGKVLKCGGEDFVGGQGILDRTATINLNDATPIWQDENPMMNPRMFHNLVLLPDRTILAVGGDNGLAMKEAELYDPALGTWDELAEMMLPRGNHSTAVLLANAKVLSAGGDDGTAEIFSPPYLFDVNGVAPQPEIGYAPTLVLYASQFGVSLTSASPVGATEIEKVTLVRLASVTHSIDMDQRYVSLAFQTDPSRPNRLIVEAPENPSLAPPGYYMLFLISDTGVPCKLAKYVRLYDSPTT